MKINEIILKNKYYFLLAFVFILIFTAFFIFSNETKNGFEFKKNDLEITNEVEKDFEEDLNSILKLLD